MSVKASLSLKLLTRTIKYDQNGHVISDVIHNHIMGKSYPTPKRKKKKVWSVS